MTRYVAAGLILATLLVFVAAVPVDAKSTNAHPHAAAVATFVDVQTDVIQVGGSLTVASSADGVVTCYGSLDDGTIVWAYPFVGSHDLYTYSTVGVSQAWAADYVPLNGSCVLYQQNPVSGVPDEVARDTFTLLPVAS
jgi:hypothetical protein